MNGTTRLCLALHIILFHEKISNPKLQIDPMMNKKLNHLLALAMVLLCTFGMVTAQQSVIHPYAGNGGTFSQFNGPNTFYNYYDNGGQFGNYSTNSTTGYVSFAPQTAGGKVDVVFSQFVTNASFDALYVYDGATTASPKIASANPVPIGGSPWGAGGFNGTMAPNNIGPNNVRATFANPSGALTFAWKCSFFSNAGWAAKVTQVIPCNPIPGATINAALSPGVCVANVNVTLPATYNPGGCINNPASNNLRYILDADPPVNIPKPLPATITLLNVPSGSHTITWQVVAGTGSVIGQAIQNLEINDTEKPVLDCPSDIIINLDPGLCCAYVSWGEVTATDNCPFIGPAMELLQTCTYTNYWTGYALDLD